MNGRTTLDPQSRVPMSLSSRILIGEAIVLIIALVIAVLLGMLGWKHHHDAEFPEPTFTPQQLVTQ